MEPVLKGRPGRPKHSDVRYVSLCNNGIFLSRVLYEKMGSPGYVEAYKDGIDMVCIPRDVDGPNHLRHTNITGKQRSYFYCVSLADNFHLGKFIFVLKLDKTLIIKNCVKRLENGQINKKPRGRPRKDIFKEIIC